MILRASLACALVALAGCKSSNPGVPRRAHAADLAPTQPASPQPVEAATPREPEPEAAAPVTVPEPVRVEVQPVVARIDGEDITAGELLAAWMHADSQGVRDILERMVSARIVDAEAERLGVELDPQLVKDEFRMAVGELERELQVEQPGMTLEEWIARGLGLDPGPYLARLEADVRRRLLAERVVRVFVYTQEWAEARVIILESEEEALEARRRVAEGEPFARVASQLSVDPTGRAGGRIPPILRNESSLSRLAFATQPGGLGGPILEGGKWMVLGLDAVHPPLGGSWETIREDIERSLVERPIEDPEYWMWKVEMNDRHPVDFEPLLDVVGDGPAR